MGNVASYISNLDLKFEIFHSQKLRAKQTAQIFASSMQVSEKEIEGLKPLDDVKIAQEFIEKQKDNVMLVGHLPHLNKLASLLLVGDENADVIGFRMGGVVCLEKGQEKDEKWRVKWFLIPDLVQIG